MSHSSLALHDALRFPQLVHVSQRPLVAVAMRQTEMPGHPISVPGEEHTTPPAAGTLRSGSSGDDIPASMPLSTTMGAGASGVFASFAAPASVPASVPASDTVAASSIAASMGPAAPASEAVVGMLASTPGAPSG